MFINFKKSTTAYCLALIVSLAVLNVQPALSSKTSTTCHSSCLTCSGPAENQCLSCNKGSFITETGYCLQECKEPLRTEVINKNRVECNSPCQLNAFIYADQSCARYCNTPLEKSESAGYKFCLARCPNNKYWDSESNSCESCHSSCLTCSGPTENQCLSCNAGSFVTETGYCVKECKAPLRIENISEDRTECNSPCQLNAFIYEDQSCARYCNAPLEKSESLGFKFCLPKCSNNKYWDSKSNSCQSCHSSCLTCSGNGENDCLSCKKGSYITETGYCVDQCDGPLMLEVINNDLIECNSPCKEGAFIYEDQSCARFCEAPFGKFEFAGYSFCFEKYISEEEEEGADEEETQEEEEEDQGDDEEEDQGDEEDNGEDQEEEEEDQGDEEEEDQGDDEDNGEDQEDQEDQEDDEDNGEDQEDQEDDEEHDEDNGEDEGDEEEEEDQGDDEDNGEDQEEEEEDQGDDEEEDQGDDEEDDEEEDNGEDQQDDEEDDEDNEEDEEDEEDDENEENGEEFWMCEEDDWEGDEDSSELDLSEYNYNLEAWSTGNDDGY